MARSAGAPPMSTGSRRGRQAVVRDAAIPGVAVRLGRDPLSRAAFLSGPANDFQREGMGQLPGLNGRVGAVPRRRRRALGASEGRSCRCSPRRSVLVALAYLIGVGLGWVFFRPRARGLPVRTRC